MTELATPAPDLAECERLADQLAHLGVSARALEPVRDWVRDRRAGKPEAVWFFGTWRRAGHYWWQPGPRRPDHRSSLEPVGPWGHVDGKLTPRRTHAQSTAAVHHLAGWTAVALHDYTVDSRGGSNAVFVMDSDVSYERALQYAGEAFPEVLLRITQAAPVTLAVTCLDCEGGPEHARRR